MENLSSSGPRSGFGLGRRHERAAARMLEFAEEAASRGAFSDALGWLGTLEAVGRHLPAEYLTKQQEWRLALLDEPSPGRRPG